MQKEKQIIMVLGISLLCVGNSAQAEKLSDIQEGALYDAVGVLLLQHILKSRSERVDEGYAYSGFGRSHPVDPVQRAYEEGVKLISASVLLEATSAGAGAVVAKRSDNDICEWWAAR